MRTGRITQYICELDGLPSPNAITKRWRTFADRHGFEGVRLHDLRHPYVKPTTKKFITFFEVFRAAS